MTTTHPTYVVTRTDAGADLNYQCPCGCYAGFAFDRSTTDQAPESCCCGRTILVGNRALERLVAAIPAPETYGVDTQSVTMPWGQPLEVALATPPDAEHGAHAEDPLVHHGGVEAATVHDPVCHMDIAPATAAATLEHEGVTYYFCSRGCRVDFEEDPGGVLAAEAAYDHAAASGRHM